LLFTRNIFYSKRSIGIVFFYLGEFMNSKILLALCAASLAMVPACRKEDKKGKTKTEKGMSKKMKKNHKDMAK